MPRRPFSTDFHRDLPKGRMEPYRLWFEYLKFAWKHPDYNSLINREVYAAWGDVSKASFDEWWKRKWRELFATPASIELVTDATKRQSYAADKESVVVRLRRRDSMKTQLAELKRLLETLESTKSQPLFALSASHSVSDKSLRAMLRFGELFHQTASLEDAAEQYLDWAEKWNAKVRTWNSSKKKRARRSEVFVPAELRSFVQQIRKLREQRAAAQGKVNQSDIYRQYRVGTQRLLKKFDTVVRNVARGQFPGKY